MKDEGGGEGFPPPFSGYIYPAVAAGGLFIIVLKPGLW
jgi:hypothetical protein